MEKEGYVVTLMENGMKQGYIFLLEDRLVFRSETPEELKNKRTRKEKKKEVERVPDVTMYYKDIKSVQGGLTVKVEHKDKTYKFIVYAKKEFMNTIQARLSK